MYLKMSKRTIALFISFLILCFIPACSFDKLNQTQGKGRDFDGIFQVYVTMGDDDPRSVGARNFAELLEKYSHGELKAEVHTGYVLGSDTDLIQKMKRDTGEVDIFIVSGAFFGELTNSPELEISAMPYLFKDFKTAWAFADSDVMAEFEKDLPGENMRVLTHFCGGFRCMTNSRRPIVTPDDLSGLVIRTPTGSVTMDMLFDMGAKAMPLPFDELNDALKKGYYDGQENPTPIIYYNNLYEAQKYLSITNHTYMLQNFTIAESIWEQLSREQQEILLKAAGEAAASERKASQDETEACIKLLEEDGMEVNYPDLDLFAEATEALRQQKSRKYMDEYAKVKEWLMGEGASSPGD